MYLQISNFVELCAIMNIVTLMPSSSHILVSSFLVFRHLSCVIFCTMFSVCKAGWKREINKLLCNFLVTWFLVVFGNKVTKILRNSLFIFHFVLPVFPCKQKKLYRKSRNLSDEKTKLPKYVCN